MRLRERVAAVWSAQGVMAQSIPNYRPRHGQQAMAEAVADILETGGVLVVEAGTGVGKTYAYLVSALLSGERVMVSTATKALQDQLVGRDLPLLQAALGLPVRVALLKGRSSYLCRHRLDLARQAEVAYPITVQRDLAQVESWAAQTTRGDLAELATLDEDSDAVPLVTSTRDNCLASHCPRWTSCHVYQARRNAMEAELVVVNHHLFFADLVVRESGVAELLPRVHAVIFDEAHQLNDIGVPFLSHRVEAAAPEAALLTIAPAIEELLDEPGALHRSWVFTSATLGYEPGLDAYLETTGLQNRARVLHVPSPFDYANQAALYVPTQMPDVGTSAHSLAVADLAAEAASVLGGRTLVLTTSLRAMRAIAQRLRERLQSNADPQVRVQGESSKRALTDALRQRGPNAAVGVILVACVTFWEGIDVPGDALQLVIIDKLPFSPPDDPLLQMRAARLKDMGRNPFMELHVPQAAVLLKQGAGRLIRSETDRGVLVVCDGRLVQKPYGRKIVAALPPMRRLHGEPEFQEALLALTKPSTMAR